MDEWKRIEEFYGKTGVFLCESSGEQAIAEVTHITAEGSTASEIREAEENLGRKLPESYVRFLQRMNGGIFFTQKRPSGCRAGFMIYPCEIIAENHYSRVADLKDWYDRFVEGDTESAEWMNKLIVVGEELSSGNYLILDIDKASDPEHPPVAFLDHELPFCCSRRNSRDAIIADSMEGLLVRASENPADFLVKVLGGITRYYDLENKDGDWFPIAFSNEEGQEFIYGTE